MQQINSGLKLKTVSLIVAGWLMMPLMVHAEPVPSEIKVSGDLTLNELIKEAHQRSPEIIAARANWLAHKKRIGASWAPPDPVVGFDVVGEETQTRVGPQDGRLSVMQKIPFPFSSPCAINSPWRA